MNKNQLISVVAVSAELPKNQAAAAIEALLETISQALKSGDTVSILGFGSFSITERPARDGRNPRTGEVIQILGANVPKFKAGKALKDAVNK